MESYWDKLEFYIQQAKLDPVSKKRLLESIAEFKKDELHILIVGACGCGKSSTINAVFDKDVAVVGYDVDPQTRSISVFKEDNLFLHDTPGLGETLKKTKSIGKKSSRSYKRSGMMELL